MSAGHRQRGPQEGHSTMEEGEEMRKEENEERTREFKQNDMEEGTGEEESGGGMKTGCGHEVDVGTNGVFVEFVGGIQIENILIVEKYGCVGGRRVVVKRRMAEGKRRRGGGIWSWVCSQLARVEVRV